MAAGPKDDWLQGVARVLRADTGDLRQLAQIGGGDPHTLFIGTALDGADLRGQDLRGMTFTSLDLVKVRHDEHTLIDEPAGRSPEVAEFEGVAALLLVYDTALWTDFAPILTARFPKVRFYDRRAIRKFLSAANRFEGPKIVAIDSQLDRSLGGFAPLLPRSEVVILATQRRRKRPRPGQFELSEETALPVIYTPSASSRRPRAADGPVSSEFEDTLSILISTWRTSLNTAKRLRQSVLIGAMARADHEAVSDAWAQVFGQAVTLDLLGSEMVGFERRGANGGELARRLFPNMKAPAPYTDVAKRGYDVAILADVTGQRRADPAENYENVMAGLMSDMGWPLEQPSNRLTYSPDFHVRGRGGNLKLRLKRSPPSLASLTRADPVSTPAPRVREIVFSETTSPTSTLIRLGRGELWATAQDLLTFRTKEPEIWLILAAQLRRIRLTASAKELTDFLMLILKALAEQGELPTYNTQLARLFADREAGPQFRATATRIKTGAFWLDCNINVTQVDTSSPRISWLIRIDRDGPHLRGPPQLTDRA